MPCASSVMPSRCCWSASLLLRNQAKLSRDCCRSRVSARAASTRSRPRSATGPGSVIQETVTPGSEVGSTRRRQGLRGHGPGLVRTPVGVPTADCLVQGSTSFHRRRQRQLRDPRPGDSVREQLDVGIEAAGAAAEDEVLQRAAQADVLLTAQRVERAGAAGLVDVHIDGPLRDPEEPGLGVVRVGRQDCRPDGPERARGGAPVQPALVGRPGARLENRRCRRRDS